MAYIDFLSSVHKSTQRDYLARVNDPEFPKPKAAELANQMDDQLKRLRELGAHMGQGFYFSPPLSTEAAERLLTEASRRQKLTETLRVRTPAGLPR